MGYPAGFNYVRGPVERVLSTLSSTCTVRARNPVTLSDDRTVIEAASDSSVIFGIAVHDAADSIYPGKILVEIPTPTTVYAVPVQTGVASSALSIGQSYSLEKSGNHLRVNTDSQVTAYVTIIPRGDGSTIDSADSTVFVTFLGDMIGVLGSNASVAIFAQD